MKGNARKGSGACAKIGDEEHFNHNVRTCVNPVLITVTYNGVEMLARANQLQTSDW